MLLRVTRGQWAWPSFRPVAGEIFEHVAFQGAEEHNDTLAMMLAGLKDPVTIKKAKELDRQWREGTLPIPCVWSRRMAFLRIKGGGILAYSPVEISPSLEFALQKLGGVRAIVLPNSEHAIHWEGWKRAFPEAVVIMPAQIADRVQMPRWAGTPLLLHPGDMPSKSVGQVFEGIDVEVVGQSGFNEITLHHRASRTLITADFMYFGSNSKSDRSGWVQVGSCTELYYDAFVKSAPPDILLPSYRLQVSNFSKPNISASLAKMLSWKPQRILSVHAGKVSEGGEEEAASMLRSAWGWCSSSPSVGTIHV